jgi:DNA ligase-1
MDATSIEEIQAFLEESVKDSCEGLMVKMLTGEGSSYEPSKRSMNWLKVTPRKTILIQIKKDYLAGVGDSLDLVVVGAFHGRGKRTNVYGAYLLACYDPQSQEYQTICKIGTGFSDEVLESHTAALKPLVVSVKKSYYAHPMGGEQPSVWFEPRFVWEVLCADLSLSPRYQAAAAELGGGKGISLRFPRFIRVREDKGPEDATTSEQV